MILTTLAAHPELYLVGSNRIGQILLAILFDPDPVIRMDQLVYGRQQRRKLIGLVTQHGVVSRVADDLLRIQIPVPQAIFHRVHRQVITFFRQSQLFGRFIFAGHITPNGNQAQHLAAAVIKRQLEGVEQHGLAGQLDLFLITQRRPVFEYLFILGANSGGLFRAGKCV